MASNRSAFSNGSLAAISVSSATGALLLAEAARGASVSAWAPRCVPSCREQLACEGLLRNELKLGLMDVRWIVVMLFAALHALSHISALEWPTAGMFASGKYCFLT